MLKPPRSRANLRARLRTSIGVKPAESSTNKLSFSFSVAMVREIRAQSSSSRLAVRILVWSTRLNDANIRIIICSEGISKLNTRTGFSSDSMAFSHKFIANVVLCTQISCAIKLCRSGTVKSKTCFEPRYSIAVISSQYTDERAMWRR